MKALPLLALPLRWRCMLLAWSCVAAVLIIALADVYYQQRYQDEWDKVAVEESHHVQLQQTVLAESLTEVAYTMLYLRDQARYHLMRLSSSVQHERQDLAFDLLSFLKTNLQYEQIRLLDDQGWEMVRADYHDGYASIAPAARLQDKSSRYYVKQAMQLGHDEMYISPLDLNIEHGQVERPFKPTIRFAMPVFDDTGHRLAVLVLNYRAVSMLDAYRHVFEQTEAVSMLLNADGYWLSHPQRHYLWGHILSQRTGLSMRRTDPELWRRISQSASGQFEHGGQLVSFATVRVLDHMAAVVDVALHTGGAPLLWKVVSSFPRSVLSSRLEPLLDQLMAAGLVLWLLLTALLVSMVRGMEQRQRFERSMRLRDRAMAVAPAGLLICDAVQDDMPVIYCNDSFVQMTGFERDEVLGRNCRFLQGEDREQPEITQLAESIAAGRPCSVVLRNYRKDGSMFWNEVAIAPVYDAHGQLGHYIGYQQDVSERREMQLRKEKLLHDMEQLSQSLLAARDEERQLVACMLHDDLGQMTTALMLQLRLLRHAQKGGDQVQMAATLSEVDETAALLMQSIRGSLQRLRSEHLEELGLCDQIRQLCARWQQSGLNIVLNMDRIPHSEQTEACALDRLDMAAQRQLYHIVQEALNNVIRHAGASSVDITLEMVDGLLRLTIQDDGCGFDQASLTSGGMGLITMRERIESLRGCWLLSTSPGGGTLVGGEIPLPQQLDSP